MAALVEIRSLPPTNVGIVRDVLYAYSQRVTNPSTQYLWKKVTVGDQRTQSYAVNLATLDARQNVLIKAFAKNGQRGMDLYVGDQIEGRNTYWAQLGDYCLFHRDKTGEKRQDDSPRRNKDAAQLITEGRFDKLLEATHLLLVAKGKKQGKSDDYMRGIKHCYEEAQDMLFDILSVS